MFLSLFRSFLFFNNFLKEEIMRRMLVRAAIVLVAMCAVLLDAKAQEVRVIDGKGTVQLVTVNRVSSSAAAPVEPVEGDVWFDTSTNTTKVYDGTSWDDLDPDNVTESPSAPSIPREGDIWFDTTNSLIKLWDGNTWKNIASTDPDDLRDDQNLSVTTDSLLIEDGTGVKLSDLGTDNQKIDTLALQGDTLLQISLEGDGESAKTLDLSSLSTKEPWFGTDDDAIATENTEDIYHMGNIALGTDSATERLDVDGKLRLRNRLDKTDADTTVMILVADSNGVIDQMERYWITQASRTPSSSNIFNSSMTATQSSTYSFYSASRGINGDTSNVDRAITGSQVFPWWKIDIGSEITINRLRFFQYVTSPFRLSNFYIVFSKTDINLPATSTQTDVDNLLNNNEHTYYSGQVPSPSDDITFSDKTARYMIIVRNISTADYFQFAEIQAFNDDISLSDIGTMKKKVGIGTVSPAATLHVEGDARIETVPDGAATDSVLVRNTAGDILKINAADLGAASEPWFGADNNAGATDNNEDIYMMGNIGVGTSTLSTGKVATFAGDVDIKGVLDPTKLIFSGDGTVGSFDPTTNNQYEIEFQEGRDLEIKSNTTDSIMHIQNDGLVGIGTASPTHKLDVDGQARIRTLPDETSNDNIYITSVDTTTGVMSKIERYWKQSDNETGRVQSSSNLFNSGMTATQSSTYSSYSASRGINGDTSNVDRAITGSQVFPWWKIDIGSEITINRLRFFQYVTSPFRLSNFYIVFSKKNINLPATPTQTDVDSLLNNNEHTYYSGQIPDPSGDITFSDKTARYMIIVRNISVADYLQFAEVQVFNDDLSHDGILTNKEKLGIGVDPTQALDVDGQARIRTLKTGTSSDEVVMTDSDGVMKKLTASALSVANEPWFGVDDNAGATTNTEDIYHSGKVGIGVTTPLQNLDVNGTGMFRNGQGFTTFTGDQILLAHVSTNFKQAIRSRHHGAIDLRNAIDFFTWDAGVDAVDASPTLHGMTIAGGRVGIGGEVAPSTFLHVKNTDTTDASMVNNISSIFRLQRQGTSGNKYSQSVDFAIGTYDSIKSARTRLDIRMGLGNTDDVERTPMTIRADGRVGINENMTPDYNLDVNGTFRNSDYGKFVVMGGDYNNMDRKDRGIYLWRETDDRWGIYMSAAGAKRSFSGDTAVAGGGFAAAAIRFRVNDANDQGFIFENDNEELLLSLRGGDGLIRSKRLDDYDNRRDLAGGMVVSNTDGDIVGASNLVRVFSKGWISPGDYELLHDVGEATEVKCKFQTALCSVGERTTAKLTYWSDTGFTVEKDISAGGGSWIVGGSGTATDPYFARYRFVQCSHANVTIVVENGDLVLKKVGSLDVHLRHMLIENW